MSDFLCSRGQTSFDFLVGMSAFLVAVAFVLTFVPVVFQPFDTEAGPNMVVADRTAALLAEDLLAEDVSRPGALDTTCTTEFFDGDAAVGGCRFAQDASDLDAALGLRDHTSVNVTVESSGSVLVVSGEALEAGRSPPGTAEVVVGKRAVLVDGEHAVLTVRVW